MYDDDDDDVWFVKYVPSYTVHMGANVRGVNVLYSTHSSAVAYGVSHSHYAARQKERQRRR